MLEARSSPRAVFMAFGTKGDVLPIAAIAAALARDQPRYIVVLVTHSAHQFLARHLAALNASFVPISSPPALAEGLDQGLEGDSFSLQKKKMQSEHRHECLTAVERIFCDHASMEDDFFVINLFALEGWSLAELFQVRCVIASPYVVPYSAPSSFERKFKQEFPLMFKYFQEAPCGKISWKDVKHWMWPLFMEDWGSWRTDSLNLCSVPYMDPVTDLPLWHLRAETPFLLYGISKEVVELPDYWPSNARVCGFWFLPMEWQFSCAKCNETVSVKYPFAKHELCGDHAELESFLIMESNKCLPIFVGLSSIGSMGFLKNPRAFLLVLKCLLEATDYKIILFTAGYKPLDDAIQSFEDALSDKDAKRQQIDSKDSFLLFGDKLFCFSGSLPYSWILPKCSVAVHHGGSGSSAAALHAGVSQVLCPFTHDQFYWAERLFWLGVAPKPLQRQYLVPESDETRSIAQAANALSKAIKQALSSGIQSQALVMAERIALEDGVAEVLNVLKEGVIFQSSKSRRISSA